jgi:hypothetical protein
MRIAMTEHTNSEYQAELTGTYIWGGVVTLMGVVGLFVAARAGHGMAYYGGLAFFIFAVLFDFLMIKHVFDRLEGAVSGGLPVAVRLAISVALAYPVYAAMAESFPDKAALAGVASAIIAFALLAFANRVAIRGH